MYALIRQNADGSSALVDTYHYRDDAIVEARQRSNGGHGTFEIREVPDNRRRNITPITAYLAATAPRAPWHTAPPVWVVWRDTRNQMRQHIRGHVDSGSIERVLAAFDRLNQRMGPIYTDSALAERLAAIRIKAIQWYERGVICWSGTKQFVDRFGLEDIECEDVAHPGYTHFECDDDYCQNPDCERSERTHTVTINVRMTFTIRNQSDSYDTRDEIRRHAYIDSDGINGIDEEIEDFDASIESVYVETE